VSVHARPAVSRDHCLAPGRAGGAATYGGQYRRLFDDLPGLIGDEALLHALGAVGGRIVGEVIVGIIDADPESYRAVDPGWRPTLPASSSARYGIADPVNAAALAVG
jgi:hypothetical protein